MENPETEKNKDDNEASAEDPKSKSPPQRKMSSDRLRRLIRKLLMHNKSSYLPLRPKHIRRTLNDVKQVFATESALVEVKQPVVVVGDIHGQYSDLLRMFTMFDERKGDVMVRGCYTRSFVFLGDYVDRGKNSVECILLLLTLKLRHPERHMLLRGNHEIATINSDYGFREELIERFQYVYAEGQQLFEQFNDVFCYLPLACLVSHRTLCMHGGISPSLTSLDDIRALKKPIDMLDSPLVTDLLWADPMNGLKGFAENKLRGVSVNFGKDVLASMLHSLGLKLVIRAHQMMQAGFNFFGGDRKLITVFSAPGYAEMNNRGAVVESGKLAFKILDPPPPHEVAKK